MKIKLVFFRSYLSIGVATNTIQIPKFCRDRIEFIGYPQLFDKNIEFMNMR